MQRCQWNRKKKFAGWEQHIRTFLNFLRNLGKRAGFQLSKVQAGLDPDNWKPFDEVGSGTKEIRIRENTGIYRVMYVAKFEEAIYVLHCFQKKTEATTKHDKDVSEARYRAIVRERRDKNDNQH